MTGASPQTLATESMLVIDELRGGEREVELTLPSRLVPELVAGLRSINGRR